MVIKMIWELICWIFLLFFTLLVITVSIYFLLFHLLVPSGKREYLLLIPSSASKSDAVSQIYAAQLRAELLGRRQCNGVLVICDGLDKDTNRQCASACNACGRTRLCTISELLRISESSDKGKEETHEF